MNNILNSIKRNDNLVKLLGKLDLSIENIVNNNKNGLTFMMPNDNLINELNNDTKQVAIEKIQALFIPIYLPNVESFKSVSDDIPDLLEQKLPELVKEKSSGDTLVFNGGYIADLKSAFDNEAVWELTNKLFPTNREKSDGKHKDFTPTVSGGAEYDVNREKLFENILDMYCKEDLKTANTPMEVLSMLCNWANNEKKDTDMYNSICSQLSWDTIASLAIILQPYREDNYTYITDKELSEFCSYATDASGGAASPSYSSDLATSLSDYEKHMENTDVKSLVRDVVEARKKAFSVNTRYTIIENINKAQQDISKKMKNMNRRSMSYNEEKNLKKSLGLCETELRVVSAISQEDGPMNMSSMLNLFKKYNLSEVYLLDPKEMETTNIACYYSTAYLALRSDAMFYLPYISGSSLDNVANEKHYIKLDLKMTKPNVLNSKLGGLISNSINELE